MSQEMANTLALYQFVATLALPPAIFAAVLLGVLAVRKGTAAILRVIGKPQS
ncbi:hypothetical protein [Bradyrhizobium phage BDU-MI-1]|nr:hypothetical protein [Bradyrhizobium phage BDU-MI-1]